MFASMIFKKEPFFHGHDNYDQVYIMHYRDISSFPSPCFHFFIIFSLSSFFLSLILPDFIPYSVPSVL